MISTSGLYMEEEFAKVDVDQPQHNEVYTIKMIIGNFESQVQVPIILTVPENQPPVIEDVSLLQDHVFIFDLNEELQRKTKLIIPVSDTDSDSISIRMSATQDFLKAFIIGGLITFDVSEYKSSDDTSFVTTF